MIEKSRQIKLKGLIVFLSVLMFSCEGDSIEFNKVNGKWQLVKGINPMNGGDYLIDLQNQIIEEYTYQNERVIYDYSGVETARCNYKIDESTIIIFGENKNGSKWESEYNFRIKEDTLIIRRDGGFEYYEEYFIRIN